MTAEAVYLAAVLSSALVLLYKGWVRTDLTAMFVLLSLLVPWRPAPEGGGENMLTVTVTGLVRVPGGHEALVTLGGADFAVFLPIGAHLPRAGDELRLLALPGGLVQFAGG